MTNLRTSINRFCALPEIFNNLYDDLSIIVRDDSIHYVNYGLTKRNNRGLLTTMNIFGKVKFFILTSDNLILYSKSLNKKENIDIIPLKNLVKFKCVINSIFGYSTFRLFFSEFTIDIQIKMKEKSHTNLLKEKFTEFVSSNN